MIFSQDGKVIRVMAVADVIRDDSVEAIAEFKKMGLKTVMLTGDNQKNRRRHRKAGGSRHGYCRSASRRQKGRR